MSIFLFTTDKINHKFDSNCFFLSFLGLFYSFVGWHIEDISKGWMRCRTHCAELSAWYEHINRNRSIWQHTKRYSLAHTHITIRLSVLTICICWHILPFLHNFFLTFTHIKLLGFTSMCRKVFASKSSNIFSFCFLL